MIAVFLPLMTKPQPDTAERARLSLQSIPFGLPPKKPREGPNGSHPVR